MVQSRGVATSSGPQFKLMEMKKSCTREAHDDATKSYWSGWKEPTTLLHLKKTTTIRKNVSGAAVMGEDPLLLLLKKTLLGR